MKVIITKKQYKNLAFSLLDNIVGDLKLDSEYEQGEAYIKVLDSYGENIMDVWLRKSTIPKGCKKELNVSIEYLREIWEKQEGICPYLGIKLTINTYGKIKKDPVTSASLDRIDSSKGYVKGNIQWISRSMNYLKNDMTEQQIQEVINLIQRQKKGSN